MKSLKRAEFTLAMERESNMMRLHNLRPRPGSRHRVKRLGCGESSGHGKTSGKGHKGQKARSGGSIRLGFEGGQMPLIRRLPKRGFNNTAFHKRYAIVNLSDLNAFEAGAVVNEQLLRESNLVRGPFVGIKILGEGELKHGLKVEADKVSAAAREKIEKAGGTITLRKGGASKALIHAAEQAGTSAGEGSIEPAFQAGSKKKSSRRMPAKVKARAKKKTSQES
jgi:large subunit ribosomal protein L15